MKKQKRVFDEFITDFNKRLSDQNFLYPKTFTKSSARVTMRLYFCVVLSLVFNSVLKIYEPGNRISIIPFFFFATILLIDVFIILKIKSRRELKSNEYPVPINFFKWDSKELKAIKIRTGFIKYQTVKTEVIQSFIQIANTSITEPVQNPFKTFEKYMDYSLRLILGAWVTIIVSDLLSNFTMNKFNVAMKLIVANILLYGAIIFIWKFVFLKMFLGKPNNEKKQLKEFVYVMSNILSLRKQGKNKRNKKLKKK